ncbi:FitA-like ribbon-helix-helix domain-containing protein [Pararhizobium sp. LjRoot238]|uniref:FitA-like ribbon-helix-helix domain-containing protein n=1 Tax=Pararhizobium sp. LjRoot238 TaxID=3342293 RepID=UPI003ECCE754
MGEMNVKIDESLLMRLEDRARAHNRSLDDEVKFLLERALEKPERESLYDAARRIAAMTPKGIKQTDSVEMLREDRDR